MISSYNLLQDRRFIHPNILSGIRRLIDESLLKRQTDFLSRQSWSNDWICTMTCSMVSNWRLPLRIVFAQLRAARSHSALLLASLIDSRSSTWAIPTIRLQTEQQDFGNNIWIVFATGVKMWLMPCLVTKISQKFSRFSVTSNLWTHAESVKYR